MHGSREMVRRSPQCQGLGAMGRFLGALMQDGEVSHKRW